MTTSPSLWQTFRGAVAAGALLILPYVVLLVLGILWLWHNGWLLAWLGVAGISTAAGYGLWKRWHKNSRNRNAATLPADAPLSPRDELAWVEIQAIAATVEGEVMVNPEQLLQVSQQVIESVARHYHSGEADHAVWMFTLPELLQLTERLSKNMRQYIMANVPFGDRVKIGHLLKAYRWIDVGAKYLSMASLLYRGFRLGSPFTAAAAEASGYLKKKIFAEVSQSVTQKIAQYYVEEVGRTAIELYSERLRTPPEELPLVQQPLRLLVIGQSNAGKSSLINALTGEISAAVDVLPMTQAITSYQLSQDGMPEMILLETPGLKGAPKEIDGLLAEIEHCDMILWVLASHRPARDLDHRAMQRIHDHFSARLHLKKPPELIILTHIDRLHPFMEWHPPYDLQSAVSGKAASIRQAVEAVAEDLGFAVEEIIPVCLSGEQGRYNLDAIWLRMGCRVSDAQKTRLIRLYGKAGKEMDWDRLWQQVCGAGKVVSKSIPKFKGC